jgi:hypothetical protein
LRFILKNWSVLLFNNEEELRGNKELKKILKKLFELKASGSEEEYISGLQKSKELRRLMENIVKKKTETI